MKNIPHENMPTPGDQGSQEKSKPRVSTKVFKVFKDQFSTGDFSEERAQQIMDFINSNFDIANPQPGQEYEITLFDEQRGDFPGKLFIEEKKQLRPGPQILKISWEALDTLGIRHNSEE